MQHATIIRQRDAGDKRRRVSLSAKSWNVRALSVGIIAPI
jgi:hypothetical protein